MIPYRGLLQHFHGRLAGESLSNLAGVLGCWIPIQQLTRLRGCAKRRCMFSPMTTFWNFLVQVITPAQPCRKTVRQIQAARRRRRKPLISSFALNLFRETGHRTSIDHYTLSPSCG